jgi:hypothetical protein
MFECTPVAGSMIKRFLEHSNGSQTIRILMKPG